METNYSRRDFLRLVAVVAASSAIPKLVFADEKEETLEGLLHKGLTSDVLSLIPENLDLKAIEAIEKIEKGKISLIGRFLRTYRWDTLLSYYEKMNNIKEGLLAGIVMHESYGNPLSIGPTNDVGLWMFIPRTARSYNLRIGANSNEELKRLIEAYNHDYQKLAEIDDRFDIFKSTEAAVKFLINLKAKYGNKDSWDSVISAYNQGSPAENPSSTKYVTEVRYWQSIYFEQKKLLQKFNGRVTADTLPQFIDLNKNNFRLGEGNNKCSYVIIDGDNPSTIAMNFNEKYGDTYLKIGWPQILQNEKTVNPKRLIPGEDVYWFVVPKI